MPRASDSSPRRRYREERAAFLRRFWWLLLIGAAWFVGIAWLLDEPLDGYVLGLAQGLVMAVFAVMVVTFLHVATPATRQLKGTYGEDNTRDVLAKAQRRGIIHGWVDGVAVESGDVDHVVVMGDGRVLALDSKWHDEIGAETLARDLHSAERMARRTGSILRSLEQPTDVATAVVVWGAGQSDLTTPCTAMGGVTVLRGRDLLGWLDELPVGRLDIPAAERLLDDLEAFRDDVRPDRSRTRPAAA